MKILNGDIDMSAFFSQLKRSRDAILFLDYDGTLAPFRHDPSQAFPYPEIVPILEKLVCSQQTRTIIVTGRSVEDVVPLLPLSVIPEIWGCHGLERYSRDQQYSIRSVSKTAIDSLKMLERLIEPVITLGGRGEYKPAGIAIHWRGCADAEIKSIRQFVNEQFSGNLFQSDIDLHEFDGGLEFRVRGISKADAVRHVLELETTGDFVSAYLGDDRTDEDAFAAMKGHGLSVLVRDELRPTLADIWVKPGNETYEFLTNWYETRAVHNVRKSNAGI